MLSPKGIVADHNATPAQKKFREFEKADKDDRRSKKSPPNMQLYDKDVSAQDYLYVNTITKHVPVAHDYQIQSTFDTFLASVHKSQAENQNKT